MKYLNGHSIDDIHLDQTMRIIQLQICEFITSHLIESVNYISLDFIPEKICFSFSHRSVDVVSSHRESNKHSSNFRS